MTKALALAIISACLVLFYTMASLGQPPEARVAFVVDASQAMQEPWQTTTRLEASLAAIVTELKSLPLRAKAGVWLARSVGPEVLTAPSKANELNQVNLSAQGGGPRPDLEPSIAPALRWAAEGKPGAVIIVGLPMGGAQIDVPKDGPFVHGLITGSPSGDTGMQMPLILQCGGSLAREDNPKRLQASLHTLVRLSLSLSSLYADVRNADNEPLDVRLQIARGNSKQPARPVLSNTAAQVLAGTYVLTWPNKSDIGPGTPPALVRVPNDARAIARAGGQGKLLIRAQDATGKDQNWKFSISSVPGGAMLVSNAHTPFEQTLPAGRLLVSVVKPASSWSLDLPAGAERVLLLGPRGKLTAKLEGPNGPVRLPIIATGPGASNRQWRGYTNSPMPLPPGEYILHFGTIPAISRTLTLFPGSNQSLDLPMLGSLLVKASNITTPQRYDVINDNDQVVGQGHSGRAVPLLPGRYAVSLPGDKQLAVEITPGHITTLEIN